MYIMYWVLNIAKKPINNPFRPWDGDQWVKQIEYNINNGFDYLEVMKDMVFGGSGMISVAFQNPPNVFDCFLKKIWSPFSMNKWFC